MFNNPKIENKFLFLKTKTQCLYKISFSCFYLFLESYLKKIIKIWKMIKSKTLHIKFIF